MLTVCLTYSTRVMPECSCKLRTSFPTHILLLGVSSNTLAQATEEGLHACNIPVHAVTNDEMTLRLKGKTVCTESERYDALRHCRYVDEILTDAPWTITPEFMEEHQVRLFHCHTPSHCWKHISD